MKEALPVGALITLGLIYLRVDVVILSLLRPAHDVGIYGIASKVSEILSTVPLIIMAAMLPLLSRAVAFGDTARLRTAAQQIFQLMLCSSLGLVVGTSFVANRIAILLGGESFRAGGLPLAIVMIAIGLGFFTAFYSHLMIAHRQQKKLVVSTAAVAIANIILNVIFVPHFGYLASAWITVLSEVIIVAWYARATHRSTAYRANATNPVRMVAPVIPLTIVLYLLRGSDVYTSVVVGGVIYIATALICKSFSYQEITSLMKKPN